MVYCSVSLNSIDKLVRQRQYLISSMERLIEVTTEVTENAEELEYRLMELAKKHQELMLRVQRVVFRVESQSPVVSEAENCMMDELEGLNNHLERRMNRRLTEVCVCLCVLLYVHKLLSLQYCTNSGTKEIGVM